MFIIGPGDTRKGREDSACTAKPNKILWALPTCWRIGGENGGGNDSIYSTGFSTCR